MTKYIIGILFILAMHFFIKWIELSTRTVTKGVVIDSRSFSYGSVHGLNRSRDVVPYPIVRFKGPEITTTFSREITQAEFDSVSIEIGKLGNISQMEADMIQQIMVDGLRGKYKDSMVVKNEYITETPEGAYFFHSYPTGDSVDVIFDESYPNHARVYTFFSYWLTLPAICIIILFSLAYIGILVVASARGLN